MKDKNEREVQSVEGRRSKKREPFTVESWVVRLRYSSSFRYYRLMEGVGGLPETEELRTPGVSDLSRRSRQALFELDPAMTGSLDLSEISEPGESESREPGNRPGERIARGARRARAASRSGEGGNHNEGATGLPRPETFEVSRRPERAEEWEEVFDEYLSSLSEWRLRRERRAEDIALPDLIEVERYLETARHVDKPRSSLLERVLSYASFVSADVRERMERADDLWRRCYERNREQRIEEEAVAERETEESARAYEQEKRQWAASRGSERLRNLLEAGYEADMAYVRERALEETDGFVPLVSSRDGRVPHLRHHPEPSERALEIAGTYDELFMGSTCTRGVTSRVVVAEGADILPSQREAIRYFEEEVGHRGSVYSPALPETSYEIVLLQGFLGSYDLFKVLGAERDSTDESASELIVQKDNADQEKPLRRGLHREGGRSTPSRKDSELSGNRGSSEKGDSSDRGAFPKPERAAAIEDADSDFKDTSSAESVERVGSESTENTEEDTPGDRELLRAEDSRTEEDGVPGSTIPGLPAPRRASSLSIRKRTSRFSENEVARRRQGIALLATLLTAVLVSSLAVLITVSTMTGGDTSGNSPSVESPGYEIPANMESAYYYELVEGGTL